MLDLNSHRCAALRKAIEYPYELTMIPQKATSPARSNHATCAYLSSQLGEATKCVPNIRYRLSYIYCIVNCRIRSFRQHCTGSSSFWVRFRCLWDRCSFAATALLCWAGYHCCTGQGLDVRSVETTLYKFRATGFAPCK